MVHKLSQSFMNAHPKGARVRSSQIPIKPGIFATNKTCNYLPNALMKKEAVDAGVDFTIGIDEKNCITEGATENIGLLTRNRELLVPTASHILSGTTVLRVTELAQTLVARGELARIGCCDLRRDDLMMASEAFIFGTTPDVTAVVEFDGQKIGDGEPGPVWRTLSDLLRCDIAEGSHSVAI
jgi:branched-chain amino acid aminotransferase